MTTTPDPATVVWSSCPCGAYDPDPEAGHHPACSREDVRDVCPACEAEATPVEDGWTCEACGWADADAAAAWADEYPEDAALARSRWGVVPHYPDPVAAALALVAHQLDGLREAATVTADEDADDPEAAAWLSDVAVVLARLHLDADAARVASDALRTDALAGDHGEPTACEGCGWPLADADTLRVGDPDPSTGALAVECLACGTVTTVTP